MKDISFFTYRHLFGFKFLFQTCFRFWLKKFQLVPFIPRADKFFEPLYDTHKGNFKVRENERAQLIGAHAASRCAQQVLLKRGLQHIWVLLGGTFPSETDDSVCRGFKSFSFLFFFLFSAMLWVDICV